MEYKLKMSAHVSSCWKLRWFSWYLEKSWCLLLILAEHQILFLLMLIRKGAFFRRIVIVACAGGGITTQFSYSVSGSSLSVTPTSVGDYCGNTPTLSVPFSVYIIMVYFWRYLNYGWC